MNPASNERGGVTRGSSSLSSGKSAPSSTASPTRRIATVSTTASRWTRSRPAPGSTSLALRRLERLLPAACSIGSAVKPPLAPDRLDSWLAIKADGDVAAHFGKMDMGQGVDVAIAQIVAEELDVPFERVSVVMGDRARRDDVHRHPKGRHRRPARRCRQCRRRVGRPDAQGQLWRADRRPLFPTCR
jgi:hypothetical protein